MTLKEEGGIIPGFSWLIENYAIHLLKGGGMMTEL